MNPQEQALLEQLKDVASPAVPGWWPLALGWWLVLLVLLVVVVCGYILLKRHVAHKKLNAWRRAAVREHQQLHQEFLNGEDQTTVIAHLSVLMRRVGLAVESRRSIAPLTDEQWLSKLDHIGKTREYTTGVGRVLYRHQYQRPQTLDDDAVTRLFNLTDDTIKNAANAIVQPEGSAIAAL